MPLLFEGYASRFGLVDAAGDIIAPGAFAASLSRRGPAEIRMLYQHDPAEPIGRWLALREDATGLFVRGLLAEGVRRAEEAGALLRQRALDGLSIGFRAVRSQKERSGAPRRITEIDLWEVSIVTFPMAAGARVTRLAETDGAEREAAAAIRRASLALRPSP